MDLLRWVLLLVGAAIVVGIYLFGKGRNSTKDSFHDAPIEPLYEGDELPGITADAPDEDLHDLGSEISVVADPVMAEDWEDVAASHAHSDPVPAAGATVQDVHRQEPVPERDPIRAPESASSAGPKAERRAPSSTAPEKIIALFVTAPSGEVFRGDELFAALEAVGLEYGEMRIFHAHRESFGSRYTLFSAANMVEPGWFDVEGAEGFATPGVALFARLPGPLDALQTLDAMLETATALKDRLGGELRDATHSVMSQQTMAHLREEVQDFSRKLRVAGGH